MASRRDRGRVLAVVAADAAVLWLARPDIATLAGDLTHPRRWVATAGSDGAATALAQAGLWLCAVWVAVAVLSVAATRLPGIGGEVAAMVVGRTVPALLRRSIAGAVGASIFLAPLAAGAATPDHAPARPAVSVWVSVSALVSPSASASDSAPLDAGSWAWPTSSPPSQHADGDPAPMPVPWPHGASKPAPSGEVVVRRGDSLWAIAAHRLGPDANVHQIATASQQWYQANRHTIGADPSLIHPGQHLHEPTEKGARS